MFYGPFIAKGHMGIYTERKITALCLGAMLSAKKCRWKHSYTSIQDGVVIQGQCFH